MITLITGLLFNIAMSVYLLAVLLRLLLQLARADFYNPISQMVVRVTDPVVRAFRTFIPGYRGFDFPILVMALAVQVGAMLCLLQIYGGTLAAQDMAALTFLGIAHSIIDIYFWAIVFSVILSFVLLFSGQMGPHPFLSLTWQLTEPLLGPFRRILPPMGGLDFSPLFGFLLLQLMESGLDSLFDIERDYLYSVGSMGLVRNIQGLLFVVFDGV